MAALVILVDAQPRDPATGAAVAVRLAGGGAARGYFYGGAHYRAGIAALPRTVARLDFDGEQLSGGGVPNALQLSWSPARNADLAALAALFWQDAPVTVRIGPEGDAAPPIDTAGLVVDARVEGGALVLALADLAADLKRAVLVDRFAGTGGIEGPAAWAKAIRPRAWGRCFNVVGRAIDAGANVWCFGDPARAWDAFVEVRDRGVAATVEATTLLAWQGSAEATFAALRTAAVTEGGCVVAPSLACVKWWTAPAGDLRADIRGETAGGYVETAPEIAARIVAARSALGVDAAELAAVAAARPAPFGWFCGTESVTAAAAVSEVLGDVGLSWVIAGGAMAFRRWEWSAAVRTARSISAVRERLIKPVTGRRLGYRRNQAPMARGDLAAIVLASEMAYGDGTPLEDLKPAEPGATNSADPGSAFGPDRTVGQMLATVTQLRDDLASAASPDLSEIEAAIDEAQAGLDAARQELAGVAQRVFDVESTAGAGRGLNANSDFALGGASWVADGFAFTPEGPGFAALSTAGRFCQLLSTVVRIGSPRPLRVHAEYAIAAASSYTLIGLECLDAAGKHLAKSYAFAGARQPGPYAETFLFDGIADGVVDQLTVRFAPGTVYVQLVFYANHPNGGALTAATTKITAFRLEDAAAVEAVNARVTTEVGVLADADHALAGRIDEVQTSIGDANSRITDEVLSLTRADSVLSGRIDTAVSSIGSVDARVTSEILARSTNEMAVGARLEELSVSNSPGTLNRNPTFALFADPGGYPQNWVAWNAAGSHSRAAGRLGSYAFEQANDGLVQCGLYTDQALSPGLAAQGVIWAVLEVTVTKVSGDLGGCGVIVLSNNAYVGLNLYETTPIGAGGATGSGGDGQTYSYAKLMQIDTRGGVVIYAQTDGAAFNSGRTAKTIRWHRCSLRLASDAEVLAQKVNNDLGSRATLTYVDSAVAGEASARAEAVRNLDASLGGQISGKASISDVNTAIVNERGATASAIQNYSVSYNGQQLTMSQIAGVMAGINGRTQGYWGVSFNGGQPVLSAFYLDGNGNAQQGVTIGGNLFVQGDAIVAGTVSTSKIADRAAMDVQVWTQPGPSTTDGTAGGSSNTDDGNWVLLRQIYCPYDCTLVVIAKARQGYASGLRWCQFRLYLDGQQVDFGADQGAYLTNPVLVGSKDVAAGWRTFGLHWTPQDQSLALLETKITVLMRKR